MENINDIIASLSDDDIQMLKGVASSILGDGNQSVPNDQQLKPKNMPVSNSQGNLLSGFNLSQSELNMMLKAKSIIDKMNNTSSKNEDLIIALKPHLSEQSREKADKALRVLKLFEILPYLKELF